MSNTLRIYSYNKCSTCRKAISWLIDNNIEYQLIDIINSTPTKDEIVSATKQLGAIKYLLNTSGKSYRAIGAKKIKSMSEFQIIELLSSDSKLIKRPFVIMNTGDILVGFDELKWNNSILN